MSAALPFDDSTHAQPWPIPHGLLARAEAKAQPRRFAATPAAPSAFGALQAEVQTEPAASLDDRHFEFMTQRAEQYAARVGGDRLVALNFEIGQLRGELRDARHTLARLEGRSFAPQAGCEFTTVKLCGTEVLVEYDTEERTVIQVLIGGVWIDPEDCFGRSVIDGWNETLQQEEA